MAGYIIAQVNIKNNEPYKEYLKKVTQSAEKYNGKYIVRGGKYKVMLGNWNYERVVVIKFPTYEIAMNWYNSEEYAPIKKIREENSEGNLIIIEGI